MFRHFHARSFAPAWAGANPDDRSFVSHRFQHGRHSAGRPGGDGWGDGRRARRGDIKFILLELLSERPRHGYDLIQDLETRQGGFRRLSPGSVYPTLQMLEDGGYLTSQQEGGKRVYTVTESGRSLLAERTPLEHPGAPSEAFAEKPQTFAELRNAATELADVVMQVARSGNLDRMNRVRELLDQVKREIYLMLAEK
ncbi:PadR family transcriptional regulator [Phormidesmis priestleyi ULC007]|uniref:PadR family transcriptional regulator n=1 Tax=Phormidesmis priestleyi ULC007 TaxID=1920490 RepID=A0A2T1DGR1_9CYAN|nr:PadR family transcriptional regulator [Phormidesmis priestleyi]PSB19665.1 PadR family transcriptional regulator [Phormidesmis priestleyi ULC007]PZO53549.1 MAG: PadR family transcriptional regulator [Phormidesmis priestleyi]